MISSVNNFKKNPELSILFLWIIFRASPPIYPPLINSKTTEFCSYLRRRVTAYVHPEKKKKKKKKKAGSWWRGRKIFPFLLLQHKKGQNRVLWNRELETLLWIWVSVENSVKKIEMLNNDWWLLIWKGNNGITFRMAPPLFHSFLQKGISHWGK